VRIAFVMGGIPALGQSGSTIAAWTILAELVAAGHDVTAILLPAPELLDESGPPRLEAIRQLGVDVRVIEIPPAPRLGRVAFVRSFVAPRDGELFPAARARTALDCDAFLAFGIEAIAATAGNARGLAVLSHPPGVSRRIRARYGGTSLWERSFLFHADRRAARLLRQFASVGVCSEQHAEWARRHGASAWYAHYPMPDLAGRNWQQQRSNPKPRILMIGHLR
jgi:hypothetical protein